MGDTEVFSVRVSTDLKERLDKLAKAMERDRSWVVKDALERYVAEQLWQVEAIQEGIAAIERGETVSHEEIVARWGGELEDHMVPSGRKRSG